MNATCDPTTAIDGDDPARVRWPIALRRLAAAGAALALAACSTTMTGMGGGDLVRRGDKGVEPVLISWTSDSGGLSGRMVATLPDATFRGPFFEITQQTREESLAPLWAGWTPGWYDWPYWSYAPYGPYGVTDFITHYSGKVVANLNAPDGRTMRCRLHLAQPARGMAGGGQGECQLTGGATIRARF